MSFQNNQFKDKPRMLPLICDLKITEITEQTQNVGQLKIQIKMFLSNWKLFNLSDTLSSTIWWKSAVNDFWIKVSLFSWVIVVIIIYSVVCCMTLGYMFRKGVFQLKRLKI